jgi:hypothetical protein
MCLSLSAEVATWRANGTHSSERGCYRMTTSLTYIISFHVSAHCSCRRIRFRVCGTPAVPGRRVSSSTVLFHIIPFHSERYTSLEMESCRAWSARGVDRFERRRGRLFVTLPITYVHTHVLHLCNLYCHCLSQPLPSLSCSVHISHSITCFPAPSPTSPPDSHMLS